MNAFDIGFALLGTTGAGLAILSELKRRADYAWAMKGWQRASGLYEDARSIIHDVEIAAMAQNKLLRDQLNAIKLQRSEASRKGNATRRANELAVAQAKTAELRQYVADRKVGA